MLVCGVLQEHALQSAAVQLFIRIRTAESSISLAGSVREPDPDVSNASFAKYAARLSVRARSDPPRLGGTHETKAIVCPEGRTER